MKSKNVSLRYVLVLYALSYLWQFVIFLTGGADSALIPVLMLFPAIVAIAFRIYKKECFRNFGWGMRSRIMLNRLEPPAANLMATNNRKHGVNHVLLQ